MKKTVPRPMVGPFSRRRVLKPVFYISLVRSFKYVIRLNNWTQYNIYWISRSILLFGFPFCLWLQGEIDILVNESAKDLENKFNATNNWIKLFMKRKGLSVQVKTGKKHRPSSKLLPRMKNFH